MPKITKTMTFKEVSSIKKVGTTAIGGATGLYLQINPNGQKYYVYRYKAKDGQRSFICLGNFKTMSLVDARKEAEEWRERVRKGENPAQVKKVATEAAIGQTKALKAEVERQKRTFKAEGEAWIRERSVSGFWKNNDQGEIHHQRWLDKHVYPRIGDILIDELTSKDVFNMILPIWQDHNSTARSCLRCVRLVWSWAKAHGHVPDGIENPADRQFGTLKELLANYKADTEERHHPALHYSEIPAFFLELKRKTGIGARLVEFGILTSLRSKACRELQWEDLDFEKRTITIYKRSNKIKKKVKMFNTFMSDQVYELLMALPRDNELVFPAPQTRGVLSDATPGKVFEDLHIQSLSTGGAGWVDPVLSKLEKKLVRATFHGTSRAGLKTWSKSGEQRKIIDAEAIELCMGHKLDDPYDGAYNRATLEDERRFALQMWADYCCPKG